MKARLAALMLILALCLPSACAHALTVQAGNETIHLEDSVLGAADSGEITVFTEDGILLNDGDVLIPVQTPDARWLHSQLEGTDQLQLLQDAVSAMYLVNCLQSRDTSSGQNISVESLEAFLHFFFDAEASLVFEDNDMCSLPLSDEAYIEFSLAGAYITDISLCLSGVRDAFGEALRVNFALP